MLRLTAQRMDGKRVNRGRRMAGFGGWAARCALGAVGAGAWLAASASGWAQELAKPRINPNPLNAGWLAVEPAQIASQRYGNVTGRVTAVAIDPADATGNTVYLGTTGGGVWKSTNAAGAAGSVTFAPLTDTLPVFSANAGSAAIPSLSIGALSVGDGVVLAGTGDANDALDSYYGEGILRSADGGATWTLIQESHDGVAGEHSFVGLGVAGFAWSSTTPGLVVMAVSQSAEGAQVNALQPPYSVMGLYYSTDAGVTWQIGAIEDGSQTVQGTLTSGNPGNAVTAVVWNPVRQMFYAAVRFHGYYQSVDGVTWTRLAQQPGAGLTTTACPTNPGSVGSVGCPIFRGALAVQAVTGDTFALTVDANNLDQGLWQDVCGAERAASCASESDCVWDAAWLRRRWRWAAEAQRLRRRTTIWRWPRWRVGQADTLLFVGTVDLYRCSLAAGAACCGIRRMRKTDALAPAMVSPAQHAIATLAARGRAGCRWLFWETMAGRGDRWTGWTSSRRRARPNDATHFRI